MAYLTKCGPCQVGDHANHYRVVQAVPEGVIGGAICDCEGECVGRRRLPAWERQTKNVTFRLSARVAWALEELAEHEETSVSEIVREALANRWGLK